MFLYLILFLKTEFILQLEFNFIIIYKINDIINNLFP